MLTFLFGIVSPPLNQLPYCKAAITALIECLLKAPPSSYLSIAELLDSSCSYSAEIIISITHFGRICK